MTDSREGAKARSKEWNAEEVSALVVDCGYRLHVELGPGLLESVYEVVLAKMLEDRGLLINFGATTFKEGVKRIVHDHRDFASSRLRVNQNVGAGPALGGGKSPVERKFNHRSA